MVNTTNTELNQYNIDIMYNRHNETCFKPIIKIVQDLEFGSITVS